MKLLMAVLAFLNWYYIPFESPTAPVEVEGVDLNLKRNEIAFTFLSLSDGEAALIQHGSGENVLINTGGINTSPELERQLALFKVKRITKLIVTAPEGLENLKNVAEKYKVDEIVVGKRSQGGFGFTNGKSSTKVSKWEQGAKYELLPEFTARVIYDGDGEDEGIDLSFQYFHHQLFYITSTSQGSEQKFLAEDLRKVNIVKIPNYAGKQSFSEMLIEHLDPQIAIIFKSKAVKPSPDLVEMLHEAWIDVYFTKQHGTVTIKLTDSNYDVITILSKE